MPVFTVKKAEKLIDIYTSKCLVATHSMGLCSPEVASYSTHLRENRTP